MQTITIHEVQRRLHAARLARSFWKKACQYENIPVIGSKFVVFSDENPYSRAIDRARRLMYV